MPVSKKRKKDGKPVQRHEPALPVSEHAHGPDAKPAVAPPIKVGKPTNPFVAPRTAGRAAQRGR